MCDFYVLTYDDNNDLEVVADYEMGQFDLMAFWNGAVFDGEIPDEVRLWVSKGKSADYLANPISWPIISDRLWSILKPLVEKDCQILPIAMHYEKTKKKVSGYSLLNPLRVFRAAKLYGNKADASLSSLEFDRKKIPLDVHIFRLRQSSSRIIVSDEFRKAVWDKKVKGLAFLKTRSK